MLSKNPSTSLSTTLPTRSNLVAAAFAEACVRLRADAIRLSHSVEARRAGDDGAFWPIAREAMAQPVWVRARMAEDCAGLILRAGHDAEGEPEDSFGEADLRDLGWTCDQVRAHAGFALHTALVLLRPCSWSPKGDSTLQPPSHITTRATPHTEGWREAAGGAAMLASFGLLLGCGMALTALLTT
jgi:hypothetical protein